MWSASGANASFNLRRISFTRAMNHPPRLPAGCGRQTVPPAEARAAALRGGGLRQGRRLPGAQGPRPRGPILLLLPRPCPRIQPVLQLFRGHEAVRPGRLYQILLDRPPADLADGPAPRAVPSAA